MIVEDLSSQITVARISRAMDTARSTIYYRCQLKKVLLAALSWPLSRKLLTFRISECKSFFGSFLQ